MNKRVNTLVETAERVLGTKVEKVTAPGGKSRSSYRLYLKDRAVIATWRPNFRRTHLEAMALRALSPLCDDVPEFLAIDGEILFQSDVGTRRLNAEMARSSENVQIDLAYEAVCGIFRIHLAAQQTDLHQLMPHLGTTPAWVRGLVAGIDVLENVGDGLPTGFDRTAVQAALTVPCTQFVKWDCRSGNAAIDPRDHLRWFDFEYSGVRHGAEDLAWLLGDEAWPVKPEVMHAIVAEAYDPAISGPWVDYDRYLSLYTTFHAMQRLKLILSEAQRRGWIPRRKTLVYDDAGVHPVFAAHICRVGAYFADRHPLTAMLVPTLEQATAFFDNLAAGSETGT